MNSNSWISQVTAKDVSDIVRLAKLLGLEQWTENDLFAELDREGSIFLGIYTKKDGIIGFIVARKLPGENANSVDIDLLNIGIEPAYQKRGCGRMLLDALFCSCQSTGSVNVFLEVRSANRSAVDFYQACGFELVGTRKDFYRNPDDDALIMKFATAP